LGRPEHRAFDTAADQAAEHQDDARPILRYRSTCCIDTIAHPARSPDPARVVLPFLRAVPKTSKPL
jgi:hypothetical protein